MVLAVVENQLPRPEVAASLARRSAVSPTSDDSSTSVLAVIAPHATKETPLTSPHTIRRVTADDVPAVKALALDNKMFEPEQMGDFEEMLSGYLEGTLDQHVWEVAVDDVGVVVGAVYYAPEPFADRMWNLYFIAVRPDRHRDGLGHGLIDHVEEQLRQRGDQVARVLIVETSSLDGYDQARAFYRKRAYDEEARIRDFYGPGDAKVVFWKSLVDTTS